MTSPLVSISGLEKRFDLSGSLLEQITFEGGRFRRKQEAVHAINGVDLEVPAGELTVLLGRNGAGKSTTLRTIMGLTTITGGKVRFRGEDITGQPTPRIARKGIAFVPEDMGIFTDLTVAENMILAAANGPMDQKRLAWIKELFPPIGSFWNSSAGTLSGGQKQRVAIARARSLQKRSFDPATSVIN